MDGPLAGLRVLETSQGIAERYCGRLFAALGASVVRRAGGNDGLIGYAGAAGEAYGRWLDQYKQAAEPTGSFDLVIAGPDAAAVAAGAAVAADLPDDPSLLAITWFPTSGPYATWRGTDELILALSGVAYGFGRSQGPPMLAQGHGPQIVAGLTAFNAALAALLAPNRPKRIAVNVFEAFMCLTETGALTARIDGTVARRLGVNRFVPTYPCSSYRTADGWLGVTALTPAQWTALCGLIGRPDLARDPRFATTYERLMLGDEVDAALAPAFLSRTTAQWIAAGDLGRIPMAPMLGLSELPKAEHWTLRGNFAAFDPTGALAPTLPFRMTFDGVMAARAVATGGRPLSGIRVIDFSMGWAGPLCTRTLGDLGADVIKVESDTHPDWWRGWEADQGGDPPPTEVRHNFLAVNRNKRGVALDLTTPEGLAAAKALIAGADVVVENFAAGVLAKLGLGPEICRALRPGLITVSMPAFGNGGPLSGLRAYGSTVEQASGLPFVNGEADWPPCLQHVAYGDPVAGLYAAAAVLAAIAGRPRLGGADIDLAQVACLFEVGADAIIADQVAGPVKRTGHRRARAAPVAVVRAEALDSWLAVVVDGAAAWRGLCLALGPNDWAEDHDLATLSGRARQAPMIEAALTTWASRWPAAAAAARLQELGVPAAPVQPTHILTLDPQLAAVGFWPELERRYVGRHQVPAAPFSYDGLRPALDRPAPTLGEHTAEVMAELSATPSGSRRLHPGKGHSG